MFGISKELLKRFGKYLIGLAAILILASILIRTCARKRDIKEVGDKAVLNHEIKKDVQRENELQAVIQDLKNQVQSHHKKDSLSEIAHRKEIRALKREILIARVNIKPIADTVKEVETFVQLTDSLDVVQTAMIDTLLDQKNDQFVTFNKLLSASEEKNKVQIELNQHYQDLNKQLTKQVKREKRNKVVWKVVAFGLIGGLVYQSVNN